VKSCIFVIRWFFHAEIVFFEESVLWNTLLSVNVDQCDICLSKFYRPSSVLRWKFGRFDELFKRFHADPLKGTLYHHTLGALGLPVQ
jgi:hypothetical protein